MLGGHAHVLPHFHPPISACTSGSASSAPTTVPVLTVTFSASLLPLYMSPYLGVHRWQQPLHIVLLLYFQDLLFGTAQ
jgi:hypothetical protein